MKRLLAVFGKFQERRIFLILSSVWIIMSIFFPREFLNAAVFKATVLAMSSIAVIAVGMTVLLVSGGFDLSVGSVVTLSGIVAAMCIRSGLPWFAAMAAAVLCGLAVGLGNGLMIARLRINPFITTLGMMIFVRGFATILAGGNNIPILNESYNWIGQASLAGVQLPIWICLLFVALGDFLLRKARYFRQSYYIGDNENAAMLSGIPVARVKILNYMLSGALAAVAGILLSARLGNGSLTAGLNMEFKAITGAIIGGCALSGGRGTVLGAFFGAMLMASIDSAINIMPVDSYWQEFVTGFVLIVAIVIDSIGKKER
ncbi:MAG: ABC transporter permease [Candidatus Latescibacteria bacterium]|nr:ABC transporter permease [Candidatus Latescibacterota bacterium]